MEKTVLKLREKYRLKESCGACPEAYEVYLGDREIAYLRLRHGCFTASVAAQDIYEDFPRGDGIFFDGERAHYLHKALLAIDAHVDPDGDYGCLDPDEAIPEISEEDRSENSSALDRFF